MNYYPFHLGDYAAHTAHLEPMEDLAYRRMLDLYYRTEKALPTDWREIARLIRMKDYGPAIECVLSEFFTLADDGWHSKRADAELTAMLAKQEQQATKDEHEAERMRRHRERRAQMFAALRAVGVVPAWDVPMKELQRLHDTHCNEPATDLQREQAISGNAPATAIPTPTPTPTPEEHSFVNPPDGGSTPACPVDEIVNRYHSRLPMLPKVIKVDGSRATHLRRRWAEVVKDHSDEEDPKAAALDWFDWYFSKAAKSNFLTGREKEFRADFDFLMTPSKFVRVIEGFYK